MQVFVDESGDSGIKGRQGSSPFFVVTAVIFRSDEEAQRCDRAITDLRIQLGWNPRFEFKFNKLDTQRRRQFLRTVAKYDFIYCAFAMDKAKITGPGFNFKEPFFKYPIRMLFQNAKEYLEDATVVIDKTGERLFRQQMENYLKKHTNSGTSEKLSIKRVIMHESHRDNLVQLADMVCGAVARSLKTDKTDFRIYRGLIAHREVHFQRWPAGKK